MAPPFIRRVQIENFRSIASCDVALGPLMFIVGRNGSGKSNFLDALRLVSEILRDGLGMRWMTAAESATPRVFERHHHPPRNRALS